VAEQKLCPHPSTSSLPLSLDATTVTTHSTNSPHAFKLSSCYSSAGLNPQVARESRRGSSMREFRRRTLACQSRSCRASSALAKRPSCHTSCQTTSACALPWSFILSLFTHLFDIFTLSLFLSLNFSLFPSSTLLLFHYFTLSPFHSFPLSLLPSFSLFYPFTLSFFRSFALSLFHLFTLLLSHSFSLSLFLQRLSMTWRH
jgi:hypothetical protein